MADETEEQRDSSIEEKRIDIKEEPGCHYYVTEGPNNNFVGFDGNGVIQPTADGGSSSPWTSQATTCLINQYKKYRSLVGQSTQIRSLREMFEMIAKEMQNNGYSFNAQKCENKWRVLERKYKNLVYREKVNKPGRIKDYDHWEHKRALDEIFTEQNKHVYFEENGDLAPSTSTSKYLLILPKATPEQANNLSCSNNDQNGDPLANLPPNAIPDRPRMEECDYKTLSSLLEKFLDEMGKNFALAEKNKDKRHKEEMIMRQNELEVKRRLLMLKEQKMELKKRQLLAAAQHLHMNMQ